MIEIRRIHREEADQFLELLCRVFHLDVSRARPVFFDETLFDLSRKWGLFVDGHMASILTTTGLTFGWGRCIGIAGVATDPVFQKCGYATTLLERVLDVAASEAEGPAMLFAHEKKLYERLGFELNDEVVRAKVITCRPVLEFAPMPQIEVESTYEAWSSVSKNRLVRTADRWRYWGLACRTCEPFLGGYVSLEPGLLREAIVHESAPKWPVPSGTDWFGLRGLTVECGVPLRRTKVELLFMTRGITGQPQMFMTDQF